MRVTIIPSDKTVYIDNISVNFDFTVDEQIPTIHAIQWYDTFGFIEHMDEYNRMVAVESIHSLEFIQHIIDEATGIISSSANIANTNIT